MLRDSCTTGGVRSADPSHGCKPELRFFRLVGSKDCSVLGSEDASGSLGGREATAKTVAAKFVNKFCDILSGRIQ
jgi:hypothetical protein